MKDRSKATGYSTHLRIIPTTSFSTIFIADYHVIIFAPYMAQIRIDLSRAKLAANVSRLRNIVRSARKLIV
jgi:hypothetical protein